MHMPISSIWELQLLHVFTNTFVSVIFIVAILGGDIVVSYCG